MRLNVFALLSLGLLVAAGTTAAADTVTSGFQPISAEEVLRNLIHEEGPLVIDVRSPQAYARGHIPGTMNFHSKRIENRLEELAPFKDRGIVLYCAHGLNSKRAGLKLRRAGFRRLFVLEGYLTRWEEQGYPLEVSPEK